MSSNYPPGVTGGEYAIAGPDYEREILVPCEDCGEVAVVECRYRDDRWQSCQSCGWHIELEPNEPDPDRVHDEAVERRLFGEEE